jgi:hypothetical protein
MLFNGHTLDNVGWFPYLIVEYIVVSHKFSHTLYFNDNSKRIPIHNRIKELSKQGLGYRKIHRVLVQEKWKIGKSPTCVDTMIRKIKKREKFLNQGTTVEIDNVDIILVKG